MPHQKFPGITAEKNPKHSRKVSAVFRTCFECTLNEQVIYMTISRRTVKKHSNSLGRFFLPIFFLENIFWLIQDYSPKKYEIQPLIR